MALALLASASATAHAGTLGIEGSAVVFRAADGERNGLAFSYDPTAGYVDSAGKPKPGFSASDYGGLPIGAGAGCRDSVGYPRCPADGIDRIVIYLGDGNDSVSVTSIAYRGPYPTFPGTIEIRGGNGDDRMSGGSGSGGSDFSEGYLLDGGDGNDWLNGSRLWSGTMLGGPGADVLILHAESPNVTTVADGGAGDDTIYGDFNPNSRIRAGDGDDFVTLQPSPAPAELSCGAGIDIVNVGNPALTAPRFPISDDCEPLPTAKVLSIKPGNLALAVRKRLTVRVRCSRKCRIGGRVSLYAGPILDESTVTLTGSGRIAFNLDRRAFKARRKRLQIDLFLRMGRAQGAQSTMRSKVVASNKLRFNRRPFRPFSITPCPPSCHPLLPPTE